MSAPFEGGARSKDHAKKAERGRQVMAEAVTVLKKNGYRAEEQRDGFYSVVPPGGSAPEFWQPFKVRAIAKELQQNPDTSN